MHNHLGFHNSLTPYTNIHTHTYSTISSRSSSSSPFPSSKSRFIHSTTSAESLLSFPSLLSPYITVSSPKRARRQNSFLTQSTNLTHTYILSRLPANNRITFTAFHRQRKSGILLAATQRPPWWKINDTTSLSQSDTSAVLNPKPSANNEATRSDNSKKDFKQHLKQASIASWYMDLFQKLSLSAKTSLKSSLSSSSTSPLPHSSSSAPPASSSANIKSEAPNKGKGLATVKFDGTSCVASAASFAVVPADADAFIDRFASQSKSKAEAVTVSMSATVGECVRFLKDLRQSLDSYQKQQQLDIINTNTTTTDTSTTTTSSFSSKKTNPQEFYDDHILDRFYIFDPCSDQLQGYITIQDILVHEHHTTVASILRKNEVILSMDEPFEDAVQKLRSAGVLLAPVVDKANRLVGVVTAADVIREMEMEATDDMLRFGGVRTGETSVELYFGMSLLSLVNGRIAWLAGLLLLQSVSSIILGHFQPLLERNVILALFLTMLTGTSGNAGNQSSALIIRGLATGEIKRHHFWSVIWRETKVGIILGLLLASVSFIRVCLTPGSSIISSVAVSLALFLTVSGAVVIGTAVPLVLERAGIDPCNCASPALATITDIGGVLVLCFVASMVLGT